MAIDHGRRMIPSIPFGIVASMAEGDSNDLTGYFARERQDHQRLDDTPVADENTAKREVGHATDIQRLLDVDALARGIGSLGNDFNVVGTAATSMESLEWFMSSYRQQAVGALNKRTIYRTLREETEPVPAAERTTDTIVLVAPAAQPSLLPAFERIKEMSKLPANWDREGAESLTGSAIGAAGYLIEAVAEAQYLLRRERLGPETSSPIPDGGLQVEWEGPNARIDVQINPDGSYGYLVKWGSGRDAMYEEADEAPVEKILGLIDRVFAY